MKTNDGGPAFPTTEYEINEGHYDGRYQIRQQHTGLSLRDYFAGQCLAGRISECGMPFVGFEAAYAERAYIMADAMLAAREATHA